jgi:hypothetical protein
MGTPQTSLKGWAANFIPSEYFTGIQLMYLFRIGWLAVKYRGIFTHC